MKITAIKQQIKHPDRCSVYVDSKYAFSLPDIELSNQGLLVGKELEADELQVLKNQAELSRALGQVLELLVRRPRSQWEIESYLLRKGYDIDQSQLLIERLSSKGYINDQRFAESWVANRRAFKSVSKRRLQQELKAKRVPDEIIAATLSKDAVGDGEALQALIAKKRRQTRYQDDIKLMQFLARQGFGYEDIKRSLRHDAVED